MKGYFKWVLVLLLTIHPSIFSIAQNQRDSLLDLIRSTTDKSEQISLYKKLATYYLRSNIDSALFYTTKGMIMAENLHDDYGKGIMHQMMGHVMVIKDSLNAARENYNKSLEYLEKVGKKPAQASVYLALGNINFVQNNIPEALDAYIKGEKIADSLNITDLLPHYNNNLANIYFQLEDYSKSLEYYQSALTLSTINKDYETSINILTNIANCYSQLKDYAQAKNAVKKAYQLLEKGNIADARKVQVLEADGSIEVETGNYANALNKFQEALKFLDMLGPGYLGPIAVDRANSMKNIGISYFYLGQFNNSKEALLEGYSVAEEAVLTGIRRDISKYLSSVYDSLGNLTKAYAYYKIYDVLSDSISNENTTKKITQLRMQFEFDKKLKEQEIVRLKNEAAQKRKEFYLYTAVGGATLGLIIFVLLFLLQKNKTKRIHLERQNLELDLDSRNKELTTNVMYLLRKNEFIESISDKLNKAKLLFKPENRNFIDNIIKELESSLTKDAWEEFEVRFQQVHSDFYKNLTEKYPDLTPNDLKLCAFLRLNMSTKEISAITYQSTNTLSTARYRLRKKLGLDERENLITFLNQF